MKVTVSARGRVTIPKRLRDHLRIRVGEILTIHEKEGRIVMTRERGDDPISRVFGVLKSRRRTDEVLNDLRGRGNVR